MSTAARKNAEQSGNLDGFLAKKYRAHGFHIETASPPTASTSKPPRRPWTGAELKRATAMARHADAQRIAVALNRTPKAVQSMFERAGISVNGLRAWTPQEDAFLHANGTTMPSADIGAVLQRSTDTVRRRAREIGADLQKRGRHHHCATHSPETVALYNLLRAQGATHHAAARHAGVHPSTALKWDKARLASLKTDDMHE